LYEHKMQIAVSQVRIKVLETCWISMVR